MDSGARQDVLELFITERNGSGGDIPDVPFLAAALEPGWEFEEGYVRWRVGGVDLLDGSFGLYPMNQVDAVVSVTELMLGRKSGTVEVSGSILKLSTRPLDPRHALLAMDLPSRHISPRIRNEAEHREVQAKILPTARLVIDTVRRWLEHIDSSTLRPFPYSAPGRDAPEPEPGASMRRRIDELEIAWRRLRNGR